LLLEHFSLPFNLQATKIELQVIQKGGVL
jgi:hypothetical protein